MTARSGPCSPWTTDEAVRACCSGLKPDFDLTESIAFGSAILWALSGRRWSGPCEETRYPPCCSSWSNLGAFPGSSWESLFGAYPSLPVPDGAGSWLNIWGACIGVCGSLNCIELPGPIAEITEVNIGGVVLDPSAYTIMGNRGLCRVDGGRWPCTNDLHTDAAAGWFVTYLRGPAIPAAAGFAAARFICEIGKARCGAEDCALPQRLKQIVREGVTMDFADPLTFLDEGKVGIYEVDLWLQSVNPKRLGRRGAVYRADARVGPRRLGA